MKISVGPLSAAALVFALMVVAPPALACNGKGNCGNARDHQTGAHGAPGPIAGAGLPVLAIGYGVCWLVRRRRKVH